MFFASPHLLPRSLSLHGGGICLHKIEITKRAIDKFIIYLNDIQSQRFTQPHQDEINKSVNRW